MAYIQSKASGEIIHLTDSADSKVVEFGLHGKAEQNGTPTPNAPVGIEIAGASYNLLENTATSKTVTDIDFTVNDDKSVTCNGMAGGTRVFDLKLGVPLEQGQTYILNGCPPNGSNSRYEVRIRKSDDASSLANDYGDGVQYTHTGDKVDCIIVIRSGVNAKNLTFKPMIRKASVKNDRYMPYCKGSIEVVSVGGTYTPYTETTATISTPDGLCGINGVYDEVVKYADGSGKRIQRVNREIFTIDDGWESTTVQGRNGIRTPKKSLTTDYSWKGKISNIVSSIYIGDSYCVFETTLSLEDFKTAISDLTVEVLQPLATPIITDLTAEEIAEIEKLHTFYPVTNISNDADCFMFITYNTFRYKWIEPKTDWKPTDRFNLEDFNRIKNNLAYIHDKAQRLWKRINIENMGEDMLSYELFWEVSRFNAFEKNLELINKNTFNRNYGQTQTFYENSPFIQYDELNRIESAILSIYEILKRQEMTIRRIPFRLGTFKEVRI